MNKKWTDGLRGEGYQQKGSSMADEGNGGMSLGELGRRVVRLQEMTDKDLVPAAVYQERQRHLDRELADHEKWQDQHSEGHKWLARLLAGTTISMVVTLIILLVRITGSGG